MALYGCIFYHFYYGRLETFIDYHNSEENDHDKMLIEVRKEGAKFNAI